MKHLLIIRLSAMGDVAMTVPVIRAIIYQHPSVKITIISRPFFQPFFEDIPRVNFFAVDLKDQHKGLAGIYRLYKDTKKLKIDAVADFHNVLRSKILRILYTISGIKTAKTTKNRKERRALIRPKNKVFQPIRTVFENHADTLKKLNLSIDLNNQPPLLNKKDLNTSIKTKFGTKLAQKWIGIAPFAQYPTKIYPQDLMKEVIHQLHTETNYKIFLFGGGEELQKLKILQQGLQNVEIVAGALHFKDELILIQNLDLMLSMDSGNAHMAAMFQIPVVTLWGHTHPYTGFVPFNQPMENCLTADREKYPLIPTSVYGKKQVTGYENVMRTIDPKKIVDKLLSLLSM